MQPQIAYGATSRVRDVLASLGRTEDVSFSPDGRRLAMAGFSRARIAIFDVDIAPSSKATRVDITGGVECPSPAFASPHGLCFLDNDTLVVANRDGAVTLFELPPGEPGVPLHEIIPAFIWPIDHAAPHKNPGSVCAARIDDTTFDILVCNNFGHTITRHRLVRGAGVRSSEVLLRNYLDIPDGVCVSPDRQWIAVSNHVTHTVLLYQYSPELRADSAPDGVLRCVSYPHGVSFGPDSRTLLVADAGAPYVHVFASGADAWHGVRRPAATVRVIEEAEFRKGRTNPQEGGPKGLAIDPEGRLLALTCEFQPLVFFELRDILQLALADRASAEQRKLDLAYELRLMAEISEAEASIKKAADELLIMQASRSWRITAPLRQLNRLLRRRTLQ